MPTLTLAQIKDILGDPIVLMTFRNPRTGVVRAFTDLDLPAAAVTALVAFINARFAEN
jgi:hypothetical protein